MSGIVFSGHQPVFLPYMGFFYKMYRSDVFVLDDDVQFSRGEYQNFNYIFASGKKCKITVPVIHCDGQLINQTRICYQRPWRRKILDTIRMNYGKAPHFHQVYPILQESLDNEYEKLSDLNIHLIRRFADFFGLNTKILIASVDVPTNKRKNERNVYQCIKCGGNVYFSGTGGKAYNNEEMYEKNGISVVYSDFKPVRYMESRGKDGENLSVIDYAFYRGALLPGEW